MNADTPAGIDTAAAEAAVVDTLVDLVPVVDGVRNWRMAPSYARKHLATHAARVPGRLDRLLHDVWYPIAAQPVALFTALRTTRNDAVQTPQSREVRAAYGLAYHQISATEDADERLAYLEMIAQGQGCDRLAQAYRAVTISHVWRSRWARHERLAPHIRIPVGSKVRAMDVGERSDGTRVVVTIDGGGMMRIWDLDSGRPLTDQQEVLWTPS